MNKYCLACLLLLCSGALGCSKTPLPLESFPHPLEGIYSIVDPDGDGEEITDTTFRPVKEIIGDDLEDVEITLRRSGQTGSEATKKLILELFQNTEQVAYASPIWNVAYGIEVVGTLKYKNGIEGKLAIAGHKVGFQDQTGQPWYFQWDE